MAEKKLLFVSKSNNNLFSSWKAEPPALLIAAARQCWIKDRMLVATQSG